MHHSSGVTTYPEIDSIKNILPELKGKHFHITYYANFEFERYSNERQTFFLYIIIY